MQRIPAATRGRRIERDKKLPLRVRRFHPRCFLILRLPEVARRLLSSVKSGQSRKWAQLNILPRGQTTEVQPRVLA
jgi:hypothetical protein